MRLFTNSNWWHSAYFLGIVSSCLAPASSALAQQPKLAPATTAEEFIEQLQTSRIWQYTPPDLSEEEMELATSRLRKMIPIEPFDKGRLDFNKADPQGGVVLTRRVRALLNLHRNGVEDFIRQEGQGFSRRPTSPRYLFPNYKNNLLEEIPAEPVSSKLEHEPVVELDPTIKMWTSEYPKHRPEVLPDPKFIYELDDAGMPRQQLLGVFNSQLAEKFASRTGIRGKHGNVLGFETHRVRLSDSWSRHLGATKRQLPNVAEEVDAEQDTFWKINRIQLVSLLMHEDPCVYTSVKLPNMEELSSETAQTRPLNAFEAEAIGELKSGKPLHIRATKNRIVMVGSIRLQSSCMQCHAGKKDDLLGAFSYEILRKPEVKLDSHPNPNAG